MSMLQQMKVDYFLAGAVVGLFAGLLLGRFI